MNGVLIIPTGIGAGIGGHAGDANPVCKLLAGCCDTLITHPNVVNASDINEMPENVLYVEGSQLDRFLKGEINLEPVRTYNKILVVANKPVTNETINAVNAARHTIGADIEIMGLDVPLTMKATRDDHGCATGEITGGTSLVNQVHGKEYDVLAVHTPIEVDRDIALHYYKNAGINPWGGVEAKASRLLAELINKPVAHAPLESVTPDDKDLYFIFKQKVKSRIAAEVISNCYLHCVLKGLHRAPRIIKNAIHGSHGGINNKDIDFLITPFDCWGTPHSACQNKNIPVIVVRENMTCLKRPLYKDTSAIILENYWEAAGYIMAMKSGVKPDSVRVDGHGKK